MISLSVSAQAGDQELVVLPLESDATAPQLGLDAWKVVVAEISKSKTKLKVGVRIQKDSHMMLLGPAREQARACKNSLKCLREIGKVIEAQQLVFGKVTDTEVSLVAIDVATRKKIGTGRSGAGLAKAKLDRKARAAASALIASILRKRNKPEIKDPKEENDDTAIAASPATVDAASSIPDEVALEEEPTTSEEGEAKPSLTPEPEKSAQVAEPPRVVTQTEAAPPLVTQTAVEPTKNEDQVTKKWWFWTTIATAVLVGGATTVVLAGGLKGGPSVPGDTGSVAGTY